MKKFEGLIIEESLQDNSILGLVKVIRKEKWDVDKPGNFLPKTWTACYIQGNENQADTFAEKLSHFIKPKGCYANISTNKHIYVIFPHKIFKYEKRDKQKRIEAIEFGRSLEIPERQLDWTE